MLDLKTVLAVGGTVVGVAGLGINFIRFSEERPRVTLDVQSVRVTSNFDATGVAETLDSIETQFGRLTGFKVIGLRDRARTWTSEVPSEELTAFRDSLSVAIDVFDDAKDGWTTADIRLTDEGLEWPDGMTFTIGEIESRHRLPEGTAERWAQNPRAALRDSILNAGLEIYSGGASYEREALTAALRTIRLTLTDYLNDLDKRLEVDLLIRNQSKAATVMRSMGLIQVLPKNENPIGVQIDLDGDLHLDPLSVIQTTMHSLPLQSLSEEDRETLRRALDSEASCGVVLTDLYDMIWADACVLTSWRSGELLRKLRHAASMRFAAAP